MSRFDLPADRRRFLAAMSSLLAAQAFGQEQRESVQHEICVFTKPFNSLSFDELADKVAELGFDGIEAPIRRGGHIEPEQVEDRLPALVEALAKRKLAITVLTSDVNDPADPLTRRVLRTAATLGIKRYRMKYLKYELDQPIVEQIDAWRPQLKELAAMNHDFGVQGLYQNHAGTTYLGAALWDIRRALEGISVSDIGVAYDIRHATVEGANSWPITFDMIRPHVATVYVKDFQWNGKKVENVPLGQGHVDPQFFKLLAKSGFSGPISLHEEYLDHRKPELVPAHWAAIKQDLAKLREWI
jgi:sugar phosphate isomerase/epimerase